MGVLGDFIQNNPEARVLLEGRVGMELATSVGLGPILLAAAPRGDGHPVLVMPGWMAGDASTVPLRGFVRGLGYRAHGWGLGRNRGPESTRVRALEDRLSELADDLSELRDRLPAEHFSAGTWIHSSPATYSRPVSTSPAVFPVGSA